MAKQSALRVVAPTSVKRTRSKDRTRLRVGINTAQRLLDSSELLFADMDMKERPCDPSQKRLANMLAS